MTKHPQNPDEFADYLDEFFFSETSANEQISDDPLVDAAHRLIHEAHPKPSLQTALRIQAQLFAEADHIQQQTPTTPRIRRISWKPLALVASLMLTMLFLPMSVSASVPGDLLYPVKRSVEQLELAVASPEDQSGVYLRHAYNRAQETLTLLERGELSEPLFEDTLANITLAIDSSQSASPSDDPELMGQHLQIHTLLDYVVDEADRQEIVDPETIATLSSDLKMNQERVGILPMDASVTPDMPFIIVTPMAPTMMTTPDVIVPMHTNTIEAMPPATSMDTFRNGDSPIQIYAQPELETTQIAILEPDTSIEVIGEDADGVWLNVRLPDGTEGWLTRETMAVEQDIPDNNIETQSTTPMPQPDYTPNNLSETPANNALSTTPMSQPNNTNVAPNGGTTQPDNPNNAPNTSFNGAPNSGTTLPDNGNNTMPNTPANTMPNSDMAQPDNNNNMPNTAPNNPQNGRP